MSSALVPDGQLNLFGKVTTLVFRFAHSKKPFSGELSDTYLLTAIAEPLNRIAPTITPLKNLLERVTRKFVIAIF